MEELEELKKEKERYFASRTREMEDFNAQVENFAVGCGMHVEKLKNQMEEVTYLFVICLFSQYIVHIITRQVLVEFMYVCMFAITMLF